MRLALFIAACSLQAQWPQWGGPNRNFTIEAKLRPWGPEGPKKLWTRPLGEGYSGITAANGRLYTMFHRDADEVVIAIDAQTGKTVWEHSYYAPFTNDARELGPGPNSQPLLVGDRLFTFGVRAKLTALDAKTGKPVWSADLRNDYSVPQLIYGHSASPLAYGNLVVIPAGGTDKAFMAFDQATGRPVWNARSYGGAYVSPVLISAAGQEQIVGVTATHIVSIDPKSSYELWKWPQKAEFGINIASPLWSAGDNMLFVTSAYAAGTKALELRSENGKPEIREVWSSQKFRVKHGNLIRIGDTLYGGSGDSGACPLTAVDAKTGKILWQDRQFPTAKMVHLGSQTLVLDEDGQLALVTLSPTGLQALAKAQIMTRLSWTPPTVAGTRVYLRDRASLTALDLQ